MLGQRRSIGMDAHRDALEAGHDGGGLGGGR
jgi:hypothetical protein